MFDGISSGGELSTLEELDVGDNRMLDDLPSGLSKCRQLRKLVIKNTKLDSVPSALKNWTALVEFNMSENGQIESLPGSCFSVSWSQKCKFGKTHAAG